MDTSQDAVPDPETVFRAVRTTILENYERDVMQHGADLELQNALATRVSARTRELWQRSQLDVGAAEALLEAERREMEAQIEQARSRLLGLAPARAERLRTEAERALGLIESGFSRAFLLGADVIGEASEPREGEVGNPATWLYDANQQWKGKTSVTGQANTCAWTMPYHPIGTIWYFVWSATFIGSCTVSAFVGYYGSRTLYALPLPFLYCGSAGATGKVKLDVYQQVGYPNPTYSKLLGHADATVLDDQYTGVIIMTSTRVDGYQMPSVTVNITSTSLVFISVTLSLQVMASGPISYSELNFQDGSNYVLPPLVAVKSTP
jgi:hypothetical protein